VITAEMPLLRQCPYVRFGPVRRKLSQFLTVPFGVISYAASASKPEVHIWLWVPKPKPLKIAPREWFETLGSNPNLRAPPKRRDFAV